MEKVDDPFCSAELQLCLTFTEALQDERGTCVFVWKKRAGTHPTGSPCKRSSTVRSVDKLLICTDDRH